MDKIKFLKNFIWLILIMIINISSLNVFANQPSEDDGIYKNESTILDGEIGEWDLEINNKPNFNEEGLEVDGDIPQREDYYTISVTVPVNMEFYVLPNSQLAMGSFYSPTYTIKNNGSKSISVNLSSFDMENGVETTPLYIEKINSTDTRTQIELKMCSIENLSTWWEIDKKIDLTKLDELGDSEKELYVLRANDEKGVTFDAEKWELPQIVSNKKKAVSNFRASFVFSINR
mgnify:FL=1